MLELIAAAFGLLLIAIALFDAFETIVLPRRVKRQVRLTRIVVRTGWRPWRAIASRLPATAAGDTMLSFYGPLSLIVLIGVWAALLIVGFALASWGLGSAITPAGEEAGFGDHLYLSGSTFFTLGLGDVRPESTVSRVITIIEAGSGFGFLALVLTYVPVLYQAFSRRETNVTLLDARAGSPPSAGEFFRRLGGNEGMDSLLELLDDWERWAAELLETHLSYGVLLLYPVATRASVVARRSHPDPRRIGARPFLQPRGGRQAPGPPHLRDGAPRVSRSQPGRVRGSHHDG